MPVALFAGIVDFVVMDGLRDSASGRFAAWLTFGVAIYFVYGYPNSVLRRGTASPVTEGLP